MQCDKAQRLFDDLSGGRLSESLSKEVCRHFEECTDCRVARQRAARLQQLLSLKRHEQPSPEYFDSFVSRFHERLQAETRTHIGWWERVRAAFTPEGWQTWHYAMAGGLGVFLVLGVWGSKEMILVARSVAADPHQVKHQVSPPITEVAQVFPPSTQPIFMGSPSLAPVDEREELSAPRYVLDRYMVTPASYDVADVHF